METISVYLFKDGEGRMLDYIYSMDTMCRQLCRRSGVSPFNCNWRGLPWDSKELLLLRKRQRAATLSILSCLTPATPQVHTAMEIPERPI